MATPITPSTYSDSTIAPKAPATAGAADRSLPMPPRIEYEAIDSKQCPASTPLGSGVECESRASPFEYALSRFGDVVMPSNSFASDKVAPVPRVTHNFVAV